MHPVLVFERIKNTSYLPKSKEKRRRTDSSTHAVSMIFVVIQSKRIYQGTHPVTAAAEAA
jgi:hypothetical protein